MNSDTIVQATKSFLLEKGFTVVQPFNIRWYNETQIMQEYHCPSPSGTGNDLGLIIGNTKTFWVPFLQFLSQQPTDWLDSQPDPVDEYTKRTMNDLMDTLRKIFPDIESQEILSKCKIIYSCTMEPPGMINFQKCAHAAGLGYYSDSCGLSLHPEYGPWFAMRAVIIFTLSAQHLVVPNLKDPLTLSQNRELKDAFQDLIKSYPKGPTQDWIDMRKRVGCFMNCEHHEYNHEMVHYHYFKDLNKLRQAVDRKRELK